MKKIIIPIIIIAIVLPIIMLISSYNGLVDVSENVERYSSDIDAELQRRNDLIPNLVETVGAYAKHEETIFTEIADARSRLLGAGNMQERAAADAQVSSALGRLMAITENYPELKSNENFINLQTQLEGTENRIKVSRIKYNEAASEYNTKIKRFPTVLIAGIFGFDKASYFEASSGADIVPKVSFD